MWWCGAIMRLFIGLIALLLAPPSASSAYKGDVVFSPPEAAGTGCIMDGNYEEGTPLSVMVVCHSQRGKRASVMPPVNVRVYDPVRGCWATSVLGSSKILYSMEMQPSHHCDL